MTEGRMRAEPSRVDAGGVPGGRAVGLRTRGFLALVLSGFLFILAPEFLAAQDPGEGQPGSGLAGIESRSDSLQTLVRERLRALQAPAPADEEGDSGEMEAEGEVEPGPIFPAPPADTASGSRSTAFTVPEGADAFMEGLLGLDGATVSAYEGTRIDYEVARRNLVLMGDEEREARFFGEGMQLNADTSIVYDDYLRMIRTRGAAEFVPENGAPVSTQRLVYSLDEGRGTALEAETVYSEGVSWIVKGDLDSVRDGELFASSTIFTSCELDHPHSYFKADQIKILADRIMVTGPVKLYFDDVPVLYLPFFVQNLGSGRASGLLTPVFSVNDIVRNSSGYNRRVANLGYYWAMSDYSDMTIAADWYSNQFVALEGRLGYRWAQRFLSGNLYVKQYWRESGSRDLALNTRHEWAISERMQLSASANYVSNSQLVLQNSLDPREVTQTIDSDGRLSRRFDWGTLTLGASRKQYLSEEKTDMTLPSLSLSLSTLTLLGAPEQSASWYNNISLSGSGSLSRKQLDRAFLPDSTFTFLNTSQLRSNGEARGTLGIGDLSLSASVSYDEDLFRDVPLDRGTEGSPRGDFQSSTLGWGAGLSYRIRLIGSTTLSPSFNVSANMLQVDSIPEASSLVQGPLRRSFGVGAQTDLYGFFGGFGPFERIRHKVSPSLSWSYSPAVESTELQQVVFGPAASGKISSFTFSLNQTWEGKLGEDAAGTVAPGIPSDPSDVGDGEADGGDTGEDLPALAGEAVADTLGALATEAEDDDGPRRLPPSTTRLLLGLNTGGITWDQVRADSLGSFIAGFMTTSISTNINSDYLRGLSLSFTTDLFDDSRFLEEKLRSFEPHLSQLSLAFSLSDQSGLVRAITRLLGGSPGEVRTEASQEVPAPPSGIGAGVDPFTGFDPNRVIPGSSSTSAASTRREGWDAQVTYSLRRPRPTDEPVNQGIQAFREPTAQMISTTISFSPTAMWNVGWVTSYDLEAGEFSDHVVRLTRDLHEWDASFGFRQTPLGNWSFQFEVALKANRDLKFDYEQRSLPQGGF